MSVSLTGVAGLPEVCAGDDLAALLAAAAPDLCDGDIVVVTSKIVSKAEGRTRVVARPGDREEAIDAETERVVATWTTDRGPTRIVVTRHGFVMAAAGVDASNAEPGTVVLLPEDPDASARRLRAGLAARLGVRVGVVVSDTFGRPWRLGQTDQAVGVAGVAVVDDLRGRTDAWGNELGVTVAALADELASAGDLVKGKLRGVPVAVVRGLDHLVTAEDGPGAAALVRPVAEDMFSMGTREALAQGRAQGRAQLLRTLRDRLRAGAVIDEAALAELAGLDESQIAR